MLKRYISSFGQFVTPRTLASALPSGTVCICHFQPDTLVPSVVEGAIFNFGQYPITLRINAGSAVPLNGALGLGDQSHEIQYDRLGAYNDDSATHDGTTFHRISIPPQASGKFAFSPRRYNADGSNMQDFLLYVQNTDTSNKAMGYVGKLDLVTFEGDMLIQTSITSPIPG